MLDEDPARRPGGPSLNPTLSRSFRAEFEEQPANVGEEKAFGDAVGIIIVIDVLMVAAMFAGLHHTEFSKAARQNQREQPHRPLA